jgi:hypothetical protein
VSAGEYVVILATPVGHPSDNHWIERKYIYLVDPKKGVVRLAWKEAD